MVEICLEISVHNRWTCQQFRFSVNFTVLSPIWDKGSIHRWKIRLSIAVHSKRGNSFEEFVRSVVGLMDYKC